MAKYCRYCGTKMRNPKDKFCYSCRKTGNAVDYFYRYIKCTSLTESEMDFLRSMGADIIACSLIIALLPAFPLIFDLMMLSAGSDEQLSLTATVILVLILVYLLWMAVTGLQLYMLSKKTANRKWKAALLKLFLVLMTLMKKRGGLLYRTNSFSKQIKQVGTIMDMIEKMVKGEPCEPAAAAEEKTAQEDFWICGFCRYKNANTDYRCRSCGKAK